MLSNPHTHTLPLTTKALEKKKKSLWSMGAQNDRHTPAKPLQCSDCYVREQLSNRIFAAPHIPLLFLTLLASTGNDIQIGLCMHWMLLRYSLRRAGQVYRNSGVCSLVAPQKGSFTVTVSPWELSFEFLTLNLHEQDSEVLFCSFKKPRHEPQFSSYFFPSTFKTGCHRRRC